MDTRTLIGLKIVPNNLDDIIAKIDKLPPTAQKQLIKEATRDLYINDFYLFARDLLGYKDMNWFTHGETVEAMESDSKRKIIVLPRGTFKSSLGCVAYPMWLLERDPNVAILLDSELYTNSRNFLREIKGHYASDKYISVFGDRRGPSWGESEIVVSHRTKNVKEASITVGGIGTTKVGQHYDCLHPDTLVLTSNGYSKIKNMRPKMRVLTSNGRFESVRTVAQKWTDKNMVGIRSNYQSEMNWVTEDHKIYVWRDNGLQWVEAKDISVTDRMAIPIPSGHTRQVSKVNQRINKLLVQKDIWRLIGYWLAEGCRTVNETNAVRLCFRHDEAWIDDVKAIVETYLGVPCRISKRTRSNTRIVRFSDPDMKEILSKFGTCAKDKHLPPMALNAHFSDQREMILGYWRGDGSQCGKTIQMGSISHDLLSGIQLVLARFQISSGISRAKEAGFGKIANQPVAWHNAAWNLHTTSPMMHLFLGQSAELNTKPFQSFFIPGFWIVGIQELKSKRYNGPVFDIEVANCHDFYSPGMIMHNCIIGDDYNSNHNSNTPEKCQKVIDHVRYNLNILNPTGEYMWIGTRYAERDVIGWLLKDILNEPHLADGKMIMSNKTLEEE